MLKEKKFADLQRLISKGRAKGYLTYDEVNNALPETSPEGMDDMIMVLDEMDIQLIDDESKINKLKVSDTVFSASGLGPGAHAIKLVCSGRKNADANFTFINLEALQVR